jgi:O-antigen/teichoic acid export membrane protein
VKDREESITSGDRAVHGLRWIGSARLITQITTWSLTAITVRLLRPEDYGLIATAGLFTTFAGLLLDGGLSVVLVSRRELPVEQQGAAVTAVLMSSVILGALIFLVAPYGSTYFDSPPLARILQVSAFYLPLTALTVVPFALLSKEMRFRQIAVIQTLSSLSQGVCTLTLAYLGTGYWALIVGNFLATGLRACLLWMTLGRLLVPNIRLGVLKPILRSSGHMIGTRMTYFATGDFDTFLLGRFGGAQILGPYALAKSLSHSALDQLAGIINQISVPAFAAKLDDSSQLRGLIKIVCLASTILFPLFWLLGTLSQEALPLVLGPRWASLIVPFCAFCFILPLRGIYTLLDSSVVGTGRTSTSFKNMIVWAVVMMPLLLICVSVGSHGMAVNGALIAWIIGFPLVFLAAMRRIARAFGARVGALLQPMLLPAVCAAISCVAVETIQLSLSARLHPLTLLGPETLVGGICYVITIRKYGRVHYDQFYEMLMRLLRRDASGTRRVDD